MVIKKIKIGSLTLKNQLFLAPMVNVTNLPYRMICRKAGAAMAYIEMLYASAIIHENPKTRKLMQTIKEDSPLGIQITGNNVKEIKDCIPYLRKYDLVDINCGCPSIRITGNQAGSYLLNNPEKIGDMIKVLKKTDLTVTAKIRLGFKRNNILQVSKEIEKAGADAITVHPRLATQGGETKADWSWIKKVKNNVGIPVIGNGDILSPEKAKEMLETTGCDGIMIARGAIGDPLIFERTLHYLRTGKLEEFNFKKNIKVFQEYLYLSKRYKMINISQLKYLGSKFIRNINGASRLRNELMSLKDFEGIKRFVKGI